MQAVSLAIEELRRGGAVVLRDADGRDWLVALTASGPVWQAAKAQDAAHELATLAGEGGAVMRPADGRDAPTVTAAALAEYRRGLDAPVDLISVADLPTVHADAPFRAHAFQSRFDGTEHMALVAPGRAQGAPLVRVHSECLTGDAFGSQRCDCGPQLQESLRRLAASPGGILIYLRGQEGRGIGLGNKMRAYALQDCGMDTVEANRALGLPEDARTYGQAAHMLRALGHQQIRLLSNNPDKVSALTRHGILVVGQERLVIPPNPFNARYLATKAQKFGHALPYPRGEVA